MTITRTHTMSQLHARHHCPACGHTSIRDNAADQESVAVYCTPRCVRSVERAGELYYAGGEA